MIISAKNIHKKYGKLEVLKGVSIEIPERKIVAITGKSGAGKSTLLHILGTLDSADSGEVAFQGQVLNFKNDKALSQFRNKKIGFVFQFHHLLPEFTAIENVMLPALLEGASKSDAEKRATEILNNLGLLARKDHKPSELSGGEQQRTAVARALINQPLVIFADEPSGNLDSENAKALHELFVKLRDEMNQSFVIVTHNMELANIADIHIQMQDGNIL